MVSFFFVKLDKLLSGVLARVFLGIGDAVLRKFSKFFGVGKKIGDGLADLLVVGCGKKRVT